MAECHPAQLEAGVITESCWQSSSEYIILSHLGDESQWFNDITCDRTRSVAVEAPLSPPLLPAMASILQWWGKVNIGSPNFKAPRINQWRFEFYRWR